MAESILAGSGIYAIRRKRTGKMYVGSTTDFRRRLSRHKRELINGTHQNKKLLNAVSKYGVDSFEFVILERCADASLLIEREQWWIDETGSSVTGYNLRKTASNNGGVQHDLVTRAKISETLSKYLQRPEVKARMSAIRKGRVFSQETRAKLSASRKGKPHTQEARARMSAIVRARPPMSAEGRKRQGEGLKRLYASGYQHPAAKKMTAAKVLELRRMFDSGETTVRALADRFSISIRQARDIANRKAWPYAEAWVE